MRRAVRLDSHRPSTLAIVSGTLLPRTILDDLGSTDAGRRLSQAACGDAERLRRRASETRRRLGPASQWRHLLECGAVPLLAAMGWQAEFERTSREREVWVTPLVGRATQACTCVVVAGWASDLQRLSRMAARASEGAGATWAVLFNGTTLRLLDTRRPYAPSYLDVSVEALADHRATREVAMRLWHPAAFGSTAAPGLLDAIVAAARDRAAATRAALDDGVHLALETFGSALGPPPHRAGRIGRNHRPSDGSAGPPDADAIFQEALTLVFRILFLLFAEARGLVPTWHPVFRASYSLNTLCAALHTPSVAPPPRGLWPTILAIGRLAHAGCDFGTLRLVAFNGRLFEPALLPLAARARVGDATVGRALLALTTMPAPAGRRLRGAVEAGMRKEAATARAPQTRGRPIAFLDLGVEQLGSVYERVLDYQPRLDRATGTTLVLEATRAVRKASGSFYTPRSLTSFLVRRTLAPLVEDATPERILELRVLDPAMGSGAFLVEACGYLTAAIERAARRRDGTGWDEAERTRVKRLVAQRCLFGVDLNPTAAQLARLSLWLAGLAKDRPLSFLDQHLRVGNSLVGASIDDLVRPPGRATRNERHDVRQLSLFTGPEFESAVRWAVPRFRALSAKPDDTPDQVRTKADDFATLIGGGGPLAGWRALSDVWCAAWFWDQSPSLGSRGVYFDLAAYCIHGRSVLGDGHARTLLDHGHRIARALGAFHWWLEFPDVFFDDSGAPAERAGFDAVVGNPPWEVLHRDPLDATPGALPSTRAAVDVEKLTRFVRESGQFPSADGHLNSYGLFVERALQLVRRQGRLGLVLPWGFTTDHRMGRLRRHVFSSAHVDTLVGFDNRQGIFPVHRGVRFALVTATASAAPRGTSCLLGLTDPAALERVRDRGRVAGGRWWTLTPAFLARAGGSRWAVPDIRDPLDAEILDHVHGTIPTMESEAGWNARFGRELHASDDRRHFHARPSGLPIVEGKHIEAFRLRSLGGPLRIDADTAARLLSGRPFDRMRLAYRDVSSPTNGQVVVAAMLPAGVVSTHTLFCLRGEREPSDGWALCGLLNSSIVSYLAAMRISNHVSAVIMHELPVPRPQDAGERAVLAQLARRAAAADGEGARVELDAACARAYGLASRHYAHVLACRLGSAARGAPYLAAFAGEPGLSSPRRSERD